MGNEDSASHSRLGVGESLVVDLSELQLTGRTGVVWGLDSPQLNANFVTIGAGDSMPEHVNVEVDVLLIVLTGAGRVEIDDDSHPIATDGVALIPRGTRRSIHSENGMTYYSVHVRRQGPTVG